MNSPGADRSFRTILGLGAALYAATALTNLGIVAIDDYASLTRRFLPAQAHSIAGIADAAGFRSPAPIVAHFGLARLALALGLDHPLDQLRFNLLIVGLIGFALMAWAGHVLFAGYAPADRQRHRTVFTLLLGFYFLAPVTFTRPMIESLAAPWVLAAAAAGAAYDRQAKRRWLVAGVAAATVAATMRPQAGVVLLALPVLVAMRRRWGDLAVFAAAAAACFVVTGLIDAALVGGFHQSLRAYFRYNLTYASTFGVSPWYTFALLFLGLSLPPVFLSRYRGFDWRERYQPLAAAWLMFGLFLAAHSVVPHKEERFVIPALPLFLALLTPLAAHLLATPGQRWRAVFFALVNGAGLLLLVSSPPQRNVLGLAEWLDHRPGIRSVVLTQDDILLPLAYIAHPVVRRVGLAAADSAAGTPRDCGMIVATLAASEAAERLAVTPRFRLVTRFTPGPLEALVVRLNPKHNARRGPILVFAPAGCRSAY